MEPIRYARSGDVNIAYQVTGDGPIDLVVVHGFFSHVEAEWEHPASRSIIERLSSFSRLIRFDKRGTGMSDRNVGLPDLETRMDDVRAVMDAAGSGRAALFGFSEGGAMSILFAATYPQRTEALVLYGCYAKRLRSHDYPWAPTWEERLETASALERTWGEDIDLETMAPNADSELRRWLVSFGRRALSPGAARDLILMNSQVDVRAALHAVQAPTLVVHRTGDRDSQLAEGRYIADHVPGARFVELPGDDHIIEVRPEPILDEIEEFLTGVRPRPLADRVLVTMLFTDLVDSTVKAKELGDASWTRRLDEHDAAVREALRRYAGEEVDTAGDSFFALFDGPARAIRCALAVRDSLAGLGFPVRAGVHTGEVERPHGEGPRGIAVHVAARVAAAAEAGEILVTATTRDLVAGSGLSFEDRGEFELKGLEARRLYSATA